MVYYISVSTQELRVLIQWIFVELRGSAAILKPLLEE